jgi:hypothetical protein
VAIILKKRCSGKTHEIKLHRDGSIQLLNHDIDTLRAFTAFGAKKPRCLDALEDWEGDPIGMLLTPGFLERNEAALIAAEWAEQVAPLAWEDTLGTGATDLTHRKPIVDALTAARMLWDTSIPFDKSALLMGDQQVGRVIGRSSGPAKEAALAVRAALEAAWAAQAAMAISKSRWINALGRVSNVAEHAQKAQVWRTRMRETNRDRAHLNRLDDRTVQAMRSKQLAAAVKVLEELRS